MRHSAIDDDQRAKAHPWKQLVAAVAHAQLRTPRPTWSPALASTSSPPASADSVAAGWLAAQSGYARAKGYITDEQARELPRPTTGELGGNTAWLRLLATLPRPHRDAVVQATAKRQLYWYLLPLATSLAQRRAIDLSLSHVNTPTWRQAPVDCEPGDLSWFDTSEGLIEGAAPMAVLPDDPYLRAGAPEGTDGLVELRDKEELFEFVYETAFRGYIEPAVQRYQALLRSHGISSRRSGLYASGLFGIAYPPYAQFQAHATALRSRSDSDATLADDPRFAERAAARVRVVGAQAAEQTTDVVRYLGQREQYLGAILLVRVHVTGDPAIPGVFPARACCGAHAGEHSNPVAQRAECGYCGLNAAPSRADRLRHDLARRGFEPAEQGPVGSKPVRRRGRLSGSQ